MKLLNRVAIVTGGSRGIGKAIALALADEGADIVIASRSLEAAGEVVHEIKVRGRKGLSIQADVSNYDDVKNMVRNAIDEFGRIDILVNNAGGSARGKMSLFADSEESTWDYVFGVNLKSVLYTCREVVGHMITQGSGNIINIGSVAGIIGLAGQVDYSAAKGAVIAFTHALAKETLSSGLRVNCVSPGPTTSAAARDIPPEVRAKISSDTIAKATGFDHFADGDDIAKLVAFIASDDAKFITGQNFPVCGVMNLGLVDSMIR